MNTRSWFLIIAFLVWGFLGSYYYLCVLQGICPAWFPGGKETPANRDLPWHREPFLLFTLANSDTLIEGDSFERAAAEILSRMTNKDTLLIRGLYSRTENNGFTLAFNRAEKAALYFTGFLQEDRLRTDVLSGEAEGNFPSDTFPAIELVLLNYVEQKDGVIEVPFEHGTVVKLIDTHLQDKLLELIVKVKNSGGTIEVKGYSNSLSTPELNFELGRKRAWAVKKYLWDMGLNPESIRTASVGSLGMGKSDSANSSNERVVIKLLTSQEPL